MTTTPSSTTFAGKTAFVTGGARGIGAAVVRRLAAGGATVAFTYQSSADTAQALVADIEAEGGRAIAIQSDAGDAAALTAAIGQVARDFGKIDILVNNAGVLRMGDVGEFALADFDLTVAVNVRAVFVAVQAVLPFMGQGGRIVNIGSTNAVRMPFAGGAVYAMSKSALLGLVQGLSRDLAPRGITINNVQPGPVNTDMNPETSDFAKVMHGLMAIPRHGHADEIAGMVAYVASPEAAFVTGASLHIDGGFAA
ncbi:SDR family oxidoreductase [Pseudoduganella namucuonensis]|uniref:3-oxoacyl-[acyl-carrier protein] reductase n=1 Tax=Pseudoduganella namucuonensis TaxID=1035707 RepID=A0A1I7M261_9BURK|nr:SDR family oxidoreductase [Pseudoduganella namucuonensis]SFV15995.1 3-oxoacyl-[acyl-carrier protein] reductase [Pseudoduganella namucuonensis]